MKHCLLSTPVLFLEVVCFSLVFLCHVLLQLLSLVPLWVDPVSQEILPKKRAWSVKLQYSSQINETDTASLEFSLKFLIHSSHFCSHPNVTLPFPNVEPRIFWVTEATVIPKSKLEKGKRTMCFKIFDKYCRYFPAVNY